MRDVDSLKAAACVLQTMQRYQHLSYGVPMHHHTLSPCVLFNLVWGRQPVLCTCSTSRTMDQFSTASYLCRYSLYRDEELLGIFSA